MRTNINLFENIPEDLLDNYSEIMTFKKGDIIALEGDVCFGVSIILSGHIHIMTHSPDGDDFIIANLKENDVFGDILLFSQEQTYMGTVYAKSSAKIWFFPKKNLNKLFHTYPTILENYIKIVSNKALFMNMRLKTLGQKNLRTKILFFLHTLPKTSKNSSTVLLNMTKKELATYLNVTRPSLSRELINMRRDGLISIDGKLITIIKKSPK